MGEEKLHEDNLNICQIDETWRERRLESVPPINQNLHSHMAIWRASGHTSPVR